MVRVCIVIGLACFLFPLYYLSYPPFAEIIEKLSPDEVVVKCNWFNSTPPDKIPSFKNGPVSLMTLATLTPENTEEILNPHVAAALVQEHYDGAAAEDEEFAKVIFQCKAPLPVTLFTTSGQAKETDYLRLVENLQAGWEYTGDPLRKMFVVSTLMQVHLSAPPAIGNVVCMELGTKEGVIPWASIFPFTLPPNKNPSGPGLDFKWDNNTGNGMDVMVITASGPDILQVCLPMYPPSMRGDWLSDLKGICNRGLAISVFWFCTVVFASCLYTGLLDVGHRRHVRLHQRDHFSRQHDDRGNN